MNEYLDKQFKVKYLELQRHYMDELRLYSISLKDPLLKL